ncbi:MAG: hypothetical protein II452_02400 [Paludibacteraceae bacterium]|nr:hypothetical protein [Paludibacteraceae bacterium]MBQ2520168.1 hypothetical protein [Paludibacteraceae bacterium]
MKKHQSYWVLLLAVLFSGTIQAKVYNYMGGYVQAGEWTLMPKESKFGPSFGGVGGLGFLYEMQAGGKYSPTRFLLQVGVGAQAGATSFIQGSSMTQVLANQLDVDGDLFDYVYDINDRHDQYRNVALQIPLMIGVQHAKFYMLAGVKVDVSIWAHTHSTALLNTYGVYNEFDEFHGMPEFQFFDNRPISGGVKTAFKPSINLSAEIGGRLGLVTNAVGYDVPKRKVEFRLAGYFEYGLMDIHYSRDQMDLGVYVEEDGRKVVRPIDTQYIKYNAGSTYPVHHTSSMVDNLVMNDIMSTEGFAAEIRNLVVGLKFTILFQLPEAGQCVICHDGYRSSAKSYKSGRGMQYEE